MRKLGIVIGIFVVVVVVAFLIFVVTFNVNKYHGTIQAELEKRLQRSVTLGDMHLGIFPPRFRVQDLAIADDPHFSPDAPFVKAQELDVSVKLLPLLHKQVEVSSLILQRPSVNLIKNEAGTWNLASLGHAPENSQSGQTPSGAAKSPPAKPVSPAQSGEPNAAPSASGEQISLGELTISDGQISVLDRQVSKTPSVYDHIDVTLKNFAPRQPFSVDAAVHVSGPASRELRLQGEGGPLVENQPATTPFRGTLSLKQVGISDVSKFLNSPALNGTDGILTGETKITSESGKLSAQGETSVQNAKVRGMELGYPITAQYDVTDDLAGDLMTIRNFILKLGSTPLQMSGTINSRNAPAQLDLNIKANSVSIAEGAKLMAASGMALSQGTNVAGTMSANIQARGSVNKPALNGNITGSNIQMSGKDIAQPVQVSSVNLNMTPSQIQSNPFNLSSGGTTLNVQFTLRNYLSPTPVVDATVRAPNAQLPAVLSMAKAYGVTSLDKVNGAGTINLDLRASGPVKSIASSEIMRALNGTMSLDFNNVKYSGADINHELASIAGFLNANATKSTPGVTNISKMTGNIVVKNGIAQTNNLQATLDLGNVGAVGTANLVDQTLNLHVTAVLTQAVSQRVGGNSVGGFMQTALANKQGELVVPALVTGTFSNPRFAPDVQQVAQMKLKGLLPSLDNPTSVGGALQNLLGGGRNSASPTQPGQQQPQQQNPVQQLMGIFGKKKKPDQPPPK
jgi:AsmA protein